jgi:hypothetical protein
MHVKGGSGADGVDGGGMVGNARACGSGRSIRLS